MQQKVLSPLGVEVADLSLRTSTSSRLRNYDDCSLIMGWSCCVARRSTMPSFHRLPGAIRRSHLHAGHRGMVTDYAHQAASLT